MALSQLLYVSRAVQKLTLRDTMTLVDQAKAKNEARGACGLLCYGGGYFLQVLEGEGDAINATFMRIARDPRHDDIRIVDYSVIPDRRFEDWSMQLVNLDDPDGPAERPEAYRNDRTHPFFSTDPQVAF